MRARAAHRAARDGRGGRGPARRPARRGRPHAARGARAARRGRGDAPVRGPRGRRHHLGPPLPRGRGDDARARPARADDGAARARRGPGRRLRRARARRPARRAAGDPRAVGQLALLARQRLGLRVGAHAGLLDVPAHRHPAPLRALRRVRRHGRRDAARAGDPGSQLPLVGRAAAAAPGDGRGAHDGRPVAAARRRGAGRARAVPGPPLRRGRARPMRRRWSCSPRTASSPPATGSMRSCSTTAARTAGAPCARRSPSCWRTARRTRASSAARASWPTPQALAADPGYARQRRCAERGGPRALLARLADEYAHPARGMLAAWTPAGEAGL